MASEKRKPSPAEALVLEEFLPYRLSVLSNRVSRAIAARYARQFDLTIPEWRIIAVLGRRDGISAKAIGEATEMDKVSVSRAAAKLTKAKRVAARPHPTDARRQLLSLTATGVDLYTRIAPIALATEQRLLASLSARDCDELNRMLDRLLAAASDL